MAFTKEIGLKDFYLRYKAREEKMGRKPHPYKLFASVVKDGNSIIRDKIINNAETIVLPYLEGRLFIRKFEKFYNETNKHTWPVNYLETKKQGFVVYHGDKYGYKWYWEKKSCRIKGKKYFKFIPCRKAKRLIADAVLRRNIDYFTNH